MITPLRIDYILVTREKVSKGIYIFTFPDLSLAGIDLAVLMPRRYFVSHYLRKCLKERLRHLKRDNISYMKGLDKKFIRIKIKKI